MSQARDNFERITFPGSSGDMLAARLDMPKGQVRAFAVFAHCFTCSKDIFAAARIAKGLSEKGLGVLRFDFSGLGASEGDFANKNFSSNVEDLKAAIRFLSEHFKPPQILIGHSLGGAAVLAAAADIPELKAVVTIGAPADIAHVSHNFKSSTEEIEEKGVAEVELGGRPFTIKKQFLDDIRKHNLEERLQDLKPALLVFHAPGDEIVGIENAGAIFAAAKHPKSFISLDDADHLLRRASDAAYIADVISSWSRRYLDENKVSDSPSDVPAGVVRVTEAGSGKYEQHVRVDGHELTADEPISVGGTDHGPSPTQFLKIGLGSCTSITLRMYADRKGWDIGPISVDVSHQKITDKAASGGKRDQFERVISIGGEVSKEQSAKILEIADKCPVHRSLSQPSKIITTLA